MYLLMMLWTPDAHALQQPRSGPIIDFGVGPGLAQSEFAGVGQLSIGWWRGRYDADYALGRFSALLVTQELDWTAPGWTYAPMLEVRRSADLFVLAPYGHVSAGPLLTSGQQLGFTVRAGAGFKFRRTKTLGFNARLSGGVDVVEGVVRPRVGFTIGAGWSAPAKKAR